MSGPDRIAGQHERDPDLHEVADIVEQCLAGVGVAREVTDALTKALLTFATHDEDGEPLVGRWHSDTVEATQTLHGWVDSIAVVGSPGTELEFAL